MTHESVCLSRGVPHLFSRCSLLVARLFLSLTRVLVLLASSLSSSSSSSRRPTAQQQQPTSTESPPPSSSSSSSHGESVMTMITMTMIEDGELCAVLCLS